MHALVVVAPAQKQGLQLEITHVSEVMRVKERLELLEKDLV